ncbi:MAG TPA: hypothetical protein VF557_14965 [Jatrophihabitans sp.]|uniref:hypothetical protein n=1 Tax=Jatrophihabitans sp. TaxID=1932789 RepID=UPI002F0A9195
MPRDSARSLRAAVVAVGALGALSLSVPASLWMAPGGVFPVLRPVDHSVQLRGLDGGGRQLSSPARLRPGSSTEIVVTGFSAAEPVLLRHSTGASAVPGGRADEHGVFRYRLTVPMTMSGTQSLTVLGSPDRAGRQLGNSPRAVVFQFVVSVDQAG